MFFFNLFMLFARLHFFMWAAKHLAQASCTELPLKKCRKKNSPKLLIIWWKNLQLLLLLLLTFALLWPILRKGIILHLLSIEKKWKLASFRPCLRKTRPLCLLCFLKSCQILLKTRPKIYHKSCFFASLVLYCNIWVV